MVPHAASSCWKAEPGDRRDWLATLDRPEAEVSESHGFARSSKIDSQTHTPALPLYWKVATIRDVEASQKLGLMYSMG